MPTRNSASRFALTTLLRPGENVLGRSNEAAVWIDDCSVSRRHAVIRVCDSGPTLEDCESRNGTYIRRQRIDGPVPLADGDGIVLGDVLLTFRAFSRDGTSIAAARSTEPIESLPVERPNKR